jgi:hypothetical protein
MIKTVIRFDTVGWHFWKDAPDSRAYLRDSHRHLFKIEVHLQVFHDDRDIEFHDLLDFCKNEFGALDPKVKGGIDFGGQSCEALARKLYWKIVLQYPNRKVTVGVFEDGEVGAVYDGENGERQE